MRPILVSAALLGLLLLSCAAPPLRLEYAPGQVKRAAGRGLVVAEDPTAALVGAAVLREGGNAVDAAIATAFALGVTYPQAGNPGGGGFAVVSLPGEEPFALDFREVAPAAATKDMFLDEDGKPSSDLSLRTALGAGVPGTVAGLEALHQRSGRLPWARLVAPAVTLAEKGFQIPAGLAESLEEHREKFVDEHAREIFVREHGRWRAGSRLVQTDLARTLTAVRDRGAKGFYEGEIARAIEGASRAAGGRLTASDLAAYEVVASAPADVPFRTRRILTMPLPSSGGVVFRQIFAIFDRAGGESTRPGTPQRIHVFAEAERRAFADRNAHLGDPTGVPAAVVEGLTADGYLDRRARTVSRGRATPSHEIEAGEGVPHDTTNLCVVAADGGAVALTYSLNTSFGTHLVVPGTGILLNNTMDDFAARPGAPNHFGLRQGERNAVRSGRRPLSSMSPTIVRDANGEVVLVLGAAGGPRILSAIAQVVLGHVGDGLPVDVAALAPRVHHQHRPDLLRIERAVVRWPPGGRHTSLEISPGEAAALETLGHLLDPRPEAIGRLTAIARDPRTGDVHGVAGPRTYGAAVAE